jgi:hypothetical protein
VRRQDPLDEVVLALEIHPSCRADLAGPEEVLQRHLAVVPVPHLAGLLLGSLVAELIAAQRSVEGDCTTNILDEVGLFAIDSLDTRPCVIGRSRHSPSQQGVRADRDERRLVRPVLDVLALDLAGGVAGEPIQYLAWIRAES